MTQISLTYVFFRCYTTRQRIFCFDKWSALLGNLHRGRPTTILRLWRRQKIHTQQYTWRCNINVKIHRFATSTCSSSPTWAQIDSYSCIPHTKQVNLSIDANKRSEIPHLPIAPKMISGPSSMASWYADHRRHISKILTHEWYNLYLSGCDLLGEFTRPKAE